MHETADVIVVGAGSTGAAAAWRLAEREAGKILLLEGNGFASISWSINNLYVDTYTAGEYTNGNAYVKRMRLEFSFVCMFM